jgi:hypothetical protein
MAASRFFAAAGLDLNPAKGLFQQPLFVEQTVNHFRKTL